MNPKKLHYILFLTILIFTLFVGSCREDVIAPDQSIGISNQPVKNISANYYSFEIAADNISFIQLDSLFMYMPNSMLYISLKRYSLGFVDLKILTDYRRILYYTRLSTNVENYSCKLLTYSPQRIILAFRNFTGRLHISISSY